MAVEGPLCMRYNQFERIGDERARWVQWEVESPTMSFPWTSPVVWAECNKRCPRDEDGRLIPDPACSCGIYATWKYSTAQGYNYGSKSVLFLVEALQHWVPGTEGFRASGVELIAIVQHTPNGNAESTIVHTPNMISMQAAAEYFNIPILDYRLVMEMIRTQWEKNNMPGRIPRYI